MVRAHDSLLVLGLGTKGSSWAFQRGPGVWRKVYAVVRSLHKCMKTITLDQEAYEILAALKVDTQDSFSKVVKRHFRRSGRIRSSAGSWEDATDDEVAALREESIATFEGRRRKR